MGLGTCGDRCNLMVESEEDRLLEGTAPATSADPEFARRRRLEQSRSSKAYAREALLERLYESGARCPRKDSPRGCDLDLRAGATTLLCVVRRPTANCVFLHSQSNLQAEFGSVAFVPETRRTSTLPDPRQFVSISIRRIPKNAYAPLTSGRSNTIHPGVSVTRIRQTGVSASGVRAADVAGHQGHVPSCPLQHPRLRHETSRKLAMRRASITKARGEPTGEVMTTAAVLHSNRASPPRSFRGFWYMRGHRITETLGTFGGYQGIWIDAERGCAARGYRIAQGRLRAGVLMDVEGCSASTTTARWRERAPARGSARSARVRPMRRFPLTKPANGSALGIGMWEPRVEACSPKARRRLRSARAPSILDQLADARRGRHPPHPPPEDRRNFLRVSICSLAAADARHLPAIPAPHCSPWNPDRACGVASHP
jgi:hypothetical protein